MVDLGLYILNDAHEPVHVADTLVWGRWLEDHRAETIVGIDHVGDYEVHTAFLGLDLDVRRFFRGARSSPPVLFETMVFSGFQRSKSILACERCSTWKEAETQHAALTAKYRAAVNS